MPNWQQADRSTWQGRETTIIREEWAMIRLFVIGEKLAIDKTERATDLKQLEYGLDQIP